MVLLSFGLVRQAGRLSSVASASVRGLRAVTANAALGYRRVTRLVVG